MKKLFKFPRWKSSVDACDCTSVTTNASDIRENEMGKFHKAAWQGDMAKLEQLVKNVDINQLDKDNRTALHLACTRGNVEVVKFLIKKNAQVNLSDKQNKTPLIKAVQEQHDLCANVLLENKADPNLVDSDGNTALHLASGIPSLSVITLLVKHGGDINVKNREGISPLTVAVQEDHKEVAEFLLKKGANVNIVDRHRRSPLMLAAANGHFDMVRLLLKYKANIELKDSRGQSAENYGELEYHDTCSVLITEHRRRPPTSLLVSPSPSKRRSKSLERISIKDVGSVERRSSTGGHKGELKRKNSEMRHLVKFSTLLDKGKTEKFDNEETGSEWGKASNASKRAVPEGPVASQNSEEFAEYPSSSMEAKRFEVFPKAAGRNLSDRWLFQGAKEPSQSLPVKNPNTAFDLVARRLEGHASEKAESSVSCKGSLLRNKEMSGPPDASSNSKKPTVSRPRTTSLLQRFSLTRKPDKQAAKKISQVELVSEAHSSRAVTLNRDLPVNDDTLSDCSEDEGRSQSKQKMKKQRIDEMEISEELDEITSSSDGTLEEDNQFRVKLEDFVSQPIKHPILKSTDHHGSSVKVTKLKEETAQLKSRMEEAKDDHCVMEQKRMQMEAELANLRSSSKQQEEDSLNTIRMAKLNKIKLEEDLRQAHVQLSQERCTNAQLQQKLKSQDCKQQTIEEDYKRTKHNVEHLRTELAHSSTKQKDLFEENEALKEQLENLRQDLRLTSDNHAQSVLESNNLITGLKCEVTLANARLEAQCKAYSLLEAKTLLQEEEQQRLKDKLASEMAIQREAFNKLSQKLSKAKARQEATQELLSKSQSEGAMLQQKLDETQKLCVAKDIAMSDAQKCSSEILAKLRSDCEDRVQLVQDRNQDLTAELREYIHQLQEEKKDKEASLKQLQAEFADLLVKVSKCETSREHHERYHVEAEEDKARLHKEVDKLQRKLEERECHWKMSVKQLEEVVHRQRALLKGAKRKLGDHKASEIMRDKVNELQAELRRQMSFRGLLEKNKSQLEDEVQSLRRQVEMNTVEHRNAEQYQQEIEERARQEIQKKIYEVNLFLQLQAATQEAQDQIKAVTEVSLRSKIQELEEELKQSHSIQHDTNAQRDALHKELKRYRQMHREERWLRKSLSNDLRRWPACGRPSDGRPKGRHCGLCGPPEDGCRYKRVQGRRGPVGRLPLDGDRGRLVSKNKQVMVHPGRKNQDRLWKRGMEFKHAPLINLTRVLTRVLGCLCALNPV
ncbi:uncharacterized protein ACBT44_009951 isoform 2-T2 [Syngnathus typhle]